MSQLFELVAAILLSIGAAGGILLALSNWIGKILAKRFEQSHRAKLEKENSQELDLLLRRREVYSRLINSMRVFVRSESKATIEEKREFLSSYDECCLWAPDKVLDAIGNFLDVQIQYAKNPSSVSNATIQTTYAKCVSRIREDSGFENTTYKYRFVSFT